MTKEELHMRTEQNQNPTQE